MAEIHKCGQGWAYCDGNCAICAANNCYTTTDTKLQFTSVKDYPPYLDYPKERKKPTNADEYFRNVTDEEIKEQILAWLQQEVSDD